MTRTSQEDAIMDNTKKCLMRNIDKIFHTYEEDSERYVCESLEKFSLLREEDIEDEDEYTYQLNGREIVNEVGDELWEFIEEILEEAREERCSESNSLKWLSEVYRTMQ